MSDEPAADKPQPMAASQPRGILGFIASLGPAIIVASVVLGPGSILTCSKVGCQFGYELLWLLAITAVLMIGMTALSARLAVVHEGSLCQELSNRLGRPVAALVGVTLFLIVASFQVSNNIAVLAGFEPVLPPMPQADTSENAERDSDVGSDNGDEAGQASRGQSPDESSIVKASPGSGRFWPLAIRAGILLVVNGFYITAVFGRRQLYRTIERLMKTLMMLIVAGFLVNCLFAMPSPSGILQGFVPSAPVGDLPYLVPRLVDGEIIDPWLAVQAMIATTFSVAGAFYQSYLVKEKNWTVNQVRRGLIDSIVGITTLATVSGMIMVTAAAALYGKVEASSLHEVNDVAEQLRPLFGPLATVFFSMAVFAAAFGPCLGNAIIGGNVLSDGFGLGSSLQGTWPRRCTVLALLIGMAVAIGLKLTGGTTIGIIIFAQALTVLGGPLLAAAMIYLAWQASERLPRWLLAVSIAGGIVATMLAARTAWRLGLMFVG